MFEGLRDNHIILVTGPQRSGTRICAKIIAHDTGFGYVDERSFRTRDLCVLRDIIASCERVVIQAPVAFRSLVNLSFDPRGREYPGLFVVVIRRPVQEIVASQLRIEWGNEQEELARYGMSPDYSEPVAKVKYDYWERYQKLHMTKFLEVEYHSLEDHQLWLPAKSRKKFESNQTKRRD